MSLTGWLIYNTWDANRNRDYIEWMIREAVLLHIDLQLMDREHFSIGVLNHQLAISYLGKPAVLPDFAIMRSIDPMFSQHMERLGVRVFNSARVSAICNDKARTHQMLAGHGIPMVDTIFVKAGMFASASIPFSMPWVIKTVGGRGGTQVFKAGSISRAEAIVSQCPGQDLVIQKVAAHEGQDMRVFVVGKQIVAAVLRYSTQDFRANFSLGGESRLVSLSPSQQDLVTKIISIINVDMVGIDFLFGEDEGLLLNEIEDVVGSRTLSLNSDINLLEIFFRHVGEQIKGSQGRE